MTAKKNIKSNMNRYLSEKNLHEKIKAGLKQIQDGNTLSEEDVAKEIQNWSKSKRKGKQ
jgi:predicted transcriptional regulator